MDESRLQQGPSYPSGVGLDQGPSSPTNGKANSSAATKPRRHSINHPLSISSTMFTHHYHHSHIPAHGLGVTPTSPLRKEFPREEDDEDEDEERSRNSSDTSSLGSTATSSSQSTTSKDSHQHPQHHHHSHSSALRHLLSSFGSKHKKKQGNGTEVTSNGEQSDDSYSGSGGMSGIVGIVSVSQTTTVSTGLQDDPFVGEPTCQRSQGSQEEEEEVHHHHHHHDHHQQQQQEETLRESCSLSAAQSIMGEAIATTLDAHEEVLHARPGYIGEYPTPVRLHSMLNREAAAVQALIRKSCNDGTDHHPHHYSINNHDDHVDKARLNADQNHDPVYLSTSGPGSFSPPPDVELSSALPFNAGLLAIKSHSMPVKRTGTFPEPPPPPPPPPVASGKEIPVRMPPSPPSSELSSVDHVSSGELLDGSRESQGSAVSDTLPSPPTLLEPSHHGGYDQAKTFGYEDHDEGGGGIEEENGFLQPSATLVPGTKKNPQHRSIFRRLIRRKSEETLGQTPGGGGGDTKQQSSVLYMSTASSRSHASILSTSSSSSPLSLPSLHGHHDSKLELEQLAFDSSQPSPPLHEPVSTTPDNAVTMTESAQKEEACPTSSTPPKAKTATKVRTRPRSSTFHVLSTSRY